MHGVILTIAVVFAAPADASAPDLAKMQGDWMVASMKANGTEVPADEAQALFRTVQENRYTVSRYSKVVGSGTFKIDATKTPRTIDSLAEKSPDGKPVLGIYEFVGEKLRICNALPGKPRPTTFDAKLLSGHTVIVWEREKK
jgi:uncharacterized protein (TIGR03067 family)